MRKPREKPLPLLTLIKTSEIADPHFIAPAPVECEPDESQQTALLEAIAMARAAGYRVSKPRKPKKFNRSKTHVGPCFVAEFADGTVTRMTTYCMADDRLDWDRGMRLARAAYASRQRTRARAEPEIVASIAPAIVAAHFERAGVVLARYEDIAY